MRPNAPKGGPPAATLGVQGSYQRRPRRLSCDLDACDKDKGGSRLLPPGQILLVLSTLYYTLTRDPSICIVITLLLLLLLLIIILIVILIIILIIFLLSRVGGRIQSQSDPCLSFQTLFTLSSSIALHLNTYKVTSSLLAYEPTVGDR